MGIRFGCAGASIAKNFIRQNPKILSGIIPADQLAGILSDDEQPHPTEPQQNALTDEEQNRMDDATTVFEWLQTLEDDVFTKVITVFSVIRQNTAYAAHIIKFLNQKPAQSASVVSQSSQVSPINKHS